MGASVGCSSATGTQSTRSSTDTSAARLSQSIRSVVRGTEVEVGRSSEKQLTRLPFTEVYGDFPGRRTYLTLNVDLVEVDDLRD